MFGDKLFDFKNVNQILYQPEKYWKRIFHMNQAAAKELWLLFIFIYNDCH